MFAESLLESSGGVKTSQRWTTLLSLSLEALVIGLLVLLPLLENQALPRMLWTVTTPVPPPPRGVEHPGHAGSGGHPADALRPVLMPTPRFTDLTAAGPGPETSNPERTCPRASLGAWSTPPARASIPRRKYLPLRNRRLRPASPS